jgi:Tn3 transposase DDE domain
MASRRSQTIWSTSFVATSPRGICLRSTCSRNPLAWSNREPFSSCSATLVANHVPCNARIIGTHEHESRFVFDILHNNTTDIQPERHSTDTHGTNQVNFWLLFLTDKGTQDDPLVVHIKGTEQSQQEAANNKDKDDREDKRKNYELLLSAMIAAAALVPLSVIIKAIQP